METTKKSSHSSPQVTREQLEAMANQVVAKCYQCGKCFAGCPMAFAMDLSPSQVMRFAQLGYIEEILNAKSPWICSACVTCTTRCPQEVDIAKVMDTVRQLSFARNPRGTASDIKIAHELFLKNVRSFGRLFEPFLILCYNLMSGKWFKDVEKGPGMLLEGKVSLFPKRIKGVREVRRIFDNVKKLRAQEATP